MIRGSLVYGNWMCLVVWFLSKMVGLCILGVYLTIGFFFLGNFSGVF